MSAVTYNYEQCSQGTEELQCDLFLLIQIKINVLADCLVKPQHRIKTMMDIYIPVTALSV